MKLIKELIEDVKVQIVEGKENSPKSYFIEGVFLQSEVGNRNGRIYPHEILKKEVNRYINESVSKNRALGELNHPETPTVNLDRVSHMITSLKEDGTNFIGRAKVLDTPMGKIVKAFIDEGVQLGVSSRGMGSLREIDGNLQEVQDDYYLSTVDVVADPSAPDAFVEGILEGKEWVWNNGKIIERNVAQYKKELIKNTKKKSIKEEVAIRLFQDFLNKISK
jgi:hypothetical protein